MESLHLFFDLFNRFAKSLYRLFRRNTKVITGNIGSRSSKRLIDILDRDPVVGDEAFSFLDQPWNFSATARFAVRDHDAANPIVAPINREDDDLRIEGTLAAPVGDGWSVFTTLGYQNNSSNIPNNDFDNFSASIGANFRF